MNSFVALCVLISTALSHAERLDGGYRPAPPNAAFSGGSGSFLGAPSRGNQIPILRQENINNGDGSFSYSYATGNGISASEQGSLKQIAGGEAAVVVSGQYEYTGPDGKLYSVKYTADENGFHPVGDHLPTPPPSNPAVNSYQGSSSYLPPNRPSYNGQSGYNY